MSRLTFDFGKKAIVSHLFKDMFINWFSTLDVGSTLCIEKHCSKHRPVAIARIFRGAAGVYLNSRDQLIN